MSRSKGAYPLWKLACATCAARWSRNSPPLGGEFAAVRGEITGLRSETRQQFYWVVGLIMATILIPIALRFLPRKVAVQSTF